MEKRTACHRYSGLVRIDDRLVHGQVLVNWVRALALTRLALVGDALAADEINRSILGAVVPHSTSLWIGSVAQAVAAVPAFPEPSDKQLLLLPDPPTALGLYDAGIHYLGLNIACLGAGSRRVRFFPQVSLTPAEYAMLDALASRGVEVYSQAIPSAPVVRWSEIQARGARLFARSLDRQ